MVIIREALLCEQTGRQTHMLTLNESVAAVCKTAANCAFSNVGINDRTPFHSTEIQETVYVIGRAGKRNSEVRVSPC